MIFGHYSNCETATLDFYEEYPGTLKVIRCHFLTFQDFDCYTDQNNVICYESSRQIRALITLWNEGS